MVKSVIYRFNCLFDWTLHNSLFYNVVVAKETVAMVEITKAVETTKAKTEEKVITHQVSDYVSLSKEEKIKVIGECARADMQKTGILASVTAAQCILESGWLKSDLAVDCNNCFGIKAGSSWTGDKKKYETGEEINGKKVTEDACFRKYDSIEASFADHSKLLSTSDRYKSVVGVTDYAEAIKIIKAGGYATDSQYVKKITSLIKKYNLTQYDN